MIQLTRHPRRPTHGLAKANDTVACSGATKESSAHRQWTLLRPQDQRTLFPWLVLAALWLLVLAARGRRDGDYSDKAAVRGVASGDVLRIAVNECRWPELCLLPGVGATLAQRIVADRAVHGPFRGPDDLERVAGIGPRKQTQLAPWLDFSCSSWPIREGDISAAGPLR